jgi:hypothetical protein
VPPGEPIDGLLRTFFRKEMPQRWPVAPRPPARPAPLPPSPRSAGTVRTHLALAASVAVLTLGSFFAAGKVQPNRAATPTFSLPDNPESHLPSELRRGKIRTSLSLEQDPMGSTTIKVDVITEDGSSPR